MGIGIALLLVAGFIWWGVQDGQKKAKIENMEVSSDAVVYYYGEECPHCEDVSEYIHENNVTQKVEFEKKEVWHNTTNSAEMLAHAEMCGLSLDEIGVPFMFARGECFIGAPGVIGYFEDAMDENNVE